MKFKVSTRAGEVTFSIQKKLYPLEIIQGAAFVLTDSVVAYVEESRGAYALTLKVKDRSLATRGKLEALAGEFVNEILNHSLRQKLLANNRSIMEHVVSRAMVSARRDPADPDQPPCASEDQLSAEQRAEIDKLIAEAEAEIAARRKTAGKSDPLRITQTWEERYGKERAG